MPWVGCGERPSRVERPRTTPHQSSDAALAIRDLVRSAAQRHGVAEDLVLGLIAVESGFRPTARSRVGARGLMQLMPRTAASLASRLGRQDYDLVDPEFNIEAGTYYLAHLVKRFGNIEHALAAYNAGPTRIGRLVRAGEPLPEYSRRYVAAVEAARQRFEVSTERAMAEAMDRAALRALLRRELYGERPDEPIH